MARARDEVWYLARSRLLPDRRVGSTEEILKAVRGVFQGEYFNVAEKPRIRIIRDVDDDRTALFFEMVESTLAAQLSASTDPSGAEYIGWLAMWPPREATDRGSIQLRNDEGAASVPDTNVYILAGPLAGNPNGVSNINFGGQILWLLSGFQAKGYCAVRFPTNGTTGSRGNGVMYGGLRLVNVPSSITLTVVGTDQNVNAVSANEITDRGFRFDMNATADTGPTNASRHFVTVAN